MVQPIGALEVSSGGTAPAAEVVLHRVNLAVGIGHDRGGDGQPGRRRGTNRRRQTVAPTHKGLVASRHIQQWARRDDVAPDTESPDWNSGKIGMDHDRGLRDVDLVHGPWPQLGPSAGSAIPGTGRSPAQGTAGSVAP